MSERIRTLHSLHTRKMRLYLNGYFQWIFFTGRVKFYIYLCYIFFCYKYFFNWYYFSPTLTTSSYVKTFNCIVLYSTQNCYASSFGSLAHWWLVKNRFHGNLSLWFFYRNIYTRITHYFAFLFSYCNLILHNSLAPLYLHYTVTSLPVTGWNPAKPWTARIISSL